MKKTPLTDEQKKANRKATRKRYYQANKEKIALERKEYYKANKDRMNETNKKYVEANKEKIVKRSKEYYKDNLEMYKESNRKYNIENRAKKQEYYRKYYKQNALGFYVVYCLPNTDVAYCGISQNPTFRMTQHRTNGNDTTDWFILQVCETKAEALEIEKAYHKQGYDGANQSNFKQVA